MTIYDETKPVTTKEEMGRLLQEEQRKKSLGNILREFLVPDKGVWFVPFYYLQLIILAEALTALAEPRIGLVIHGIVLIGLLIHGALVVSVQKRRILLSLALAPLIRLLSLSLPLQGRPLEDWYLWSGALLFVGAYFTARVIGFSGKRIGLRPGFWPGQVLFAFVGVVLGLMEYYILRPVPLAAEFTFRAIIAPALILLIFTGVLEEVIFRGILQEASLGTYGRFGINYVAILFAVLHIGYASMLDVLFVYGVAVLFGLFTQRTGSLLGVSLAHGVTNITLFLIYPFLIGLPQRQVPVPVSTTTPTVMVSATVTQVPTMTQALDETASSDEMLTVTAGVETISVTPMVTPVTEAATAEIIELTATATQPPTQTQTPTVCGAPTGWVTYTVQPNDSLFRLSQLYGVSVSELQEANCMGDSTLLRAGSQIYVPPGQPTLPTSTQTQVPTSAPTATQTSPPPATATYTNAPTATNTLVPSATTTHTPIGPMPTETPP